MAEHRGRHRRAGVGAARPRGIAGIVAGGVAALAILELVLRPVAPQLRAPPVPDVACDSLSQRSVATRQIEEGIAVANFSRCGARLTANAPVAGAPMVVLLGDSYVAARQVDDAETMGAQLERLARAGGAAVNVRQYGWGGASPAQYIVAARDIVRRWTPSRVIVVVSDNDFGADTSLGIPPRMVIARDGAVSIDSSGGSAGAASAVSEAEMFALASLLRHRWALIVERSPALVRRVFGRLDMVVSPHMDEHARPEVADAAMRMLADAYGNRLLVVYLADVRVTMGEEVAPAEMMLLAACTKHAVRCLSTRSAMLAARDSGVAVRGFSTTQIGVGHLNAAGHALVAREIWSAIGAATANPVAYSR